MIKNTLTFLFLLVTVFYCLGQTKTDSLKHLNFKGVPIDGTLNEYVYKMKLKGFKHVSTENETAILSGDFAGYKNCYVEVSTLKQKDLVYNIGVVFPEKDTWSTLSGNYFDLKQMLTEKYGKPFDVVEKFDVPSYAQPKDDQDKMYKVKFDNCKYYSIWEIGKGNIQLSIDHNGVTSCFVKLAYFDNINSQKIKEQAFDDL